MQRSKLGWYREYDIKPNYALNQRVREQIAIGDQQAGDTTIYATDPNTGQVIVDQIAVGQQQAGDRGYSRYFTNTCWSTTAW